jgi:CubicO group peptidase (beta-lactamase class C family)
MPRKVILKERIPLTPLSCDWYAAPPEMPTRAAVSASFDDARAVVREGLDRRAFPAAVVNVGSRNGATWHEAFGRLSYDELTPAATTETIFDLASLTKVIVTTSLAMRYVTERRFDPDTPVAALASDWRGADRAGVRIRHLLDHSSGLPAHLRLWERVAGRNGYRQALVSAPLEHPPGTVSVYSDPGFILLGLLLEAVGREPLDRLFAPLAKFLGSSMMFRPLASFYDRIAPTEFDSWRGRVLCGEVHDENAAAIGGVAGHAGLFGTADAVAAFARLVLATFAEPTVLGTPVLIRQFATRSTVPGSSRALGWDMALPTSSCGTRMSATAIGHTGFTGTSLWIDWERDFYAVLLTNRVHPTRANEQLIGLRARFHDALPR